MKILSFERKSAWSVDDHALKQAKRLRTRLVAAGLFLLFLFSGHILQRIEPTAAVLDIGILSVLFFGLLAGIAGLCSALWLLELLWKPLKAYREDFDKHFKKLEPWQQCITYFSVLFMSLFGFLWALAIVL